MDHFESVALADFWVDSDYARREYVLAPPTDLSIAAVEKKLGFKLPRSYIELMRHQNGGIPTRSCFPTTEPTSWSENHVALHGIFGIGESGNYSLCGALGSQFMIDEWGYPPVGIYFGDCPSAGHDMIGLDYRQCGPTGEPEVIHVDQEFDYRITHLAENFEAFIKGLVHEEVFDEEDDEGVEFVWRTEAISASVELDKKFLKLGKYLHLRQSLSSGEPGWTEMKLNVPDSWDVERIVIKDGVVRIDTKESGSYGLTRDNVGTLSLALWSGSENRSEDQLGRAWRECASLTGEV